MRRWRAAILLLVIPIAAGCSNTDGGAATPEPAAPTSSAASPGTSSAPTSSTSRPAEVDLTDADPCTTISDEALAAIGSAPAKSGADQTRPTEFSCSYRDFDSPYGSALTFDASTGYEKYGATATGVIVTPIDVAGFRAFSVEKPSRAACTVGVDVADTQSLATTTIGSFDAPSAPLCNKAAEFAAVAINALTSN